MRRATVALIFVGMVCGVHAMGNNVTGIPTPDALAAAQQQVDDALAAANALLAAAGGAANAGVAHKQALLKPVLDRAASLKATEQALVNSAAAAAGKKLKPVLDLAQGVKKHVAGSVDSTVSSALSAANGKIAAAGAAVGAVRAAGLGAANRTIDLVAGAANQTKHMAFGAAQAGIGLAQAAGSSVLGNLYDAADSFMKKPLVPCPADLLQDGDGYCFPEFKSPDFALPRPTCAEGYAMTPIGKCARKTYRKVDVCFKGPACMAPFGPSGRDACFDDKVMRVIAGLLALKKAGIELPFQVAPALAEFGAVAASAPLRLAQESVELHLGAAAKALGAGKALAGQNATDLAELGTKLMAINWPAFPDFPKLHEAVDKAVKRVPTSVLDDASKVAPRCIKTCCKEDVQIDTAFAAPKWGCPAGKGMDMVGFKCVSNPMGFAKCPAGMHSCFISSWHRPLCAVKASNCKALELFAFAHKLKKQACPAAA